MAHILNTSLKNIAGKYAELARLKITASSVRKRIEENPYYPSLLSLSDTFDRLGIKNGAFEIGDENIEFLQPPFVAYTDLPDVGKDFILVTSQTKTSIRYFHKSSRPKELSRDAFIEQFQNIVWAADADGNIDDDNYEKQLKSEKSKKLRITIWISGCTFFALFVFFAVADYTHFLAYGAISCLKVIGISAVVLLLIHDVDKDNPFVRNVCTAGSQIDCDIVLASKASKLLGTSWSEIGLFYFTSTALLLFVPGIDFFVKSTWLGFANAIALPYTGFSIYYQWRVVGKWCSLCLVVQAALLAEFIWSIINVWASGKNIVFNNYDNMFLIPALLLPPLFWHPFKYILTKAKNAEPFESAYKRLQHHPELFVRLLETQPKAPDGWQSLGITIGNTQGTITIIKVCNPYCGPCAIAHPILEQLVQQNSSIKLKLIFSVPDETEDRSALAAKHLLAIAEQGDKTLTKTALDEWYTSKQRSYAAFAQKFPIGKPFREFDTAIGEMVSWCKEAEINYTPTIFVNGYKLPDSYNLVDLKHIL